MLVVKRAKQINWINICILIPIPIWKSLKGGKFAINIKNYRVNSDIVTGVELTCFLNISVIYKPKCLKPIALIEVITKVSLLMHKGPKWFEASRVTGSRTNSECLFNV